MSDISRRSFKCKFVPYINEDNREAIVRSLIMQFEGLDANPEVTVDGNILSITVTIGHGLTPTLVRDKLLWNYFIESVTTGESLKRLEILRLPKINAEKQELGTGQLDGMEAHAFAGGEILRENTREDGEEPISQMEYKIDNADRPDGPPIRHKETVGVFGLGMSRGGSSWIKFADPGTLRGQGAPTFTEGFGGDDQDQEVVGPQDLDSKATIVDELPSVFQNRYKKATENDAGGSQFAQPFDQKTKIDNVNNTPLETRGPTAWDESGRGRTRNDTGTGLDSATNSWFSEIGEESTIPSSGTPLIGTGVSTGSLKGVLVEEDEPKSGQELPGANQFGTGNYDDGEQIMGDSWGNRFCSREPVLMHLAYDNEAGHDDGDDDGVSDSDGDDD